MSPRISTKEPIVEYRVIHTSPNYALGNADSSFPYTKFDLPAGWEVLQAGDCEQLVSFYPKIADYQNGPQKVERVRVAYFLLGRRRDKVLEELAERRAMAEKLAKDYAWVANELGCHPDDERGTVLDKARKLRKEAALADAAAKELAEALEASAGIEKRLVDALHRNNQMERDIAKARQHFGEKAWKDVTG